MRQPTSNSYVESLLERGDVYKRQVQLYSKAAREVIGQNAETGFVHTLKNNKRVEVPVDEISVQHAVKSCLLYTSRCV